MHMQNHNLEALLCAVEEGLAGVQTTMKRLVEEPPYPAALRRSLARNEDALDDLGGDNIAPSLADELTKAEEAFYEKVRKFVVGEGRASTVMCCRLSSILSLSCQVPPSRA